MHIGLQSWLHYISWFHTCIGNEQHNGLGCVHRHTLNHTLGLICTYTHTLNIQKYTSGIFHYNLSRHARWDNDKIERGGVCTWAYTYPHINCDVFGWYINSAKLCPRWTGIPGCTLFPHNAEFGILWTNPARSAFTVYALHISGTLPWLRESSKETIVTDVVVMDCFFRLLSPHRLRHGSRNHFSWQTACPYQ